MELDMKIAIVSASHRVNSRSKQTALFVEPHLKQFGFHSDIFDLAEIDLPFWCEECWNKESQVAQKWQPFAARLSACDGLVIIAPEWAGMVPPKLTNFFLLCSNQELAYKPALLISVSAGPSGTYPIAQLRMSAAKNNQMMFLPDHLILRHAGKFFEAPSEEFMRRLQFNLQVLGSLAPALKEARSTIDLKRYPFGM